MRLILLGAPASGKGTQAAVLTEKFGVPKISTGDILREAIQEGSELGLRTKPVIERGELVSDDVMTGMVEQRLDSPDARRGFVLDGFPRTVAQAKALDRILAGRNPLIIVEIEIGRAHV